MPDNILPFKSQNVVKPTKIKLSNSKGSPILEITAADNALIQKFINFMVKDLQFQSELFKKAKLPKENLEEKLHAVTLIIEYFKIISTEIYKGLD